MWLLLSLIPSIAMSRVVSYQITVDVTEAALDGKDVFKASASISGLKQGADTCFYLAFNDRNYFIDPSQTINRSLNKDKRVKPRYGGIRFIEASVPHTELSSSILKLKADTDPLKLEFAFELPKWSKEAKRQYLFHRFYPQIMSQCPEAEKTSIPTKLDLVDFLIDLRLPATWDLTTPMNVKQGRLTQRSRFATFNLTKGYRIEEMKVGDIPVTFVANSPTFDRYQEYFKQFYLRTKELLGPLPFQKMIVLESEELEKSSIPGVITINSPKQVGLDKIQTEYLNWSLWQLAFFTAQQWIGTTLWKSNPNEDWFFRGLTDLIAGVILSERPRISNIFAYSGDKPWLELRYNQGIDLLASFQYLINPDVRILNDSFEVYKPIQDQGDFDYVRHLLLMRFLNWYLEETFIFQIREFYKTNQFKVVTYLDFYQYMIKVNPALSENLEYYFSLWWSKDDWPDFELESVQYLKSEKGIYTIRADVNQPDDFLLPFDFHVVFKDGSTWKKRFARDTKEIRQTFRKEPDYVEINPGREIFDRDRFNNSDEFGGLYFWPGNAERIYDDAYVFVWLPFIGKLPGESLSLMLGLQLFRYVNSGANIVISYVPGESRTGYNATYSTKVDWLKANLDLSAVENYGAGLKNQRIVSGLLYRPFNWNIGVEGRYGLSLRNRSDLLLKEDHSTYGSIAEFSNSGISPCSRRVQLSVEKTFPNNSTEYLRNFASAIVSCQYKSFFTTVGGFVGKVVQETGISTVSLFSPQSITEARVRIDAPTLEAVPDIWSLGLDFEIPVHLPVSSLLFVLPKKSSLRFFYDKARSNSLDRDFSDYGLGLRLPLGGDVVGKRSLAIGSLSILAVLAREYDDVKNNDVGLLIDFVGKL
ncbi:MAG: hypothetical protein HRU19_17680 [Pseudobacteriovorax sp.]|nr:hypothetical protein [Pseudobacteriovorax sp.]